MLRRNRKIFRARHVIHLAINRRERLFLKAMLPQVKDATDLVQVFFYNLGLTKVEPHFAKFNYAEKLEYWASCGARW